MTRKTKAELAAEREAAMAAERALERESYPARLMRALEEATQKNNYELTVKDGYFTLHDRDSSDYDNPRSLSYPYTSNSFFALEDLESDLRDKAEERAESLRLSELRKIAWAKLSDEERHALGLTARNNW
jgi:hypothetical protein